MALSGKFLQPGVRRSSVNPRVTFKGTVDGGCDFSYEDGELRIRCLPSEALAIVTGVGGPPKGFSAALGTPPPQQADNVVPLYKAPLPATNGESSTLGPKGGDSGPPEGGNLLLVPEELRAAPRLRPIIDWFVQKGYTDADVVAGALEVQRDSIPSLKPIRELRKRVADIIAMITAETPAPPERA